LKVHRLNNKVEPVGLSGSLKARVKGEFPVLTGWARSFTSIIMEEVHLSMESLHLFNRAYLSILGLLGGSALRIAF
jgi:hypothetical protein